ncbi:uncharacterized protein LOC127619140 [Xyrauchen texanus]|uniref:uncharacterized protein LOC127619140 n=1 Tax=Xyrauchen texanus TaxID=154827 RepID=UPI0022427A00|nr:uncharacterized protein LOC127619140 [Xyrauchen texanus]
MQYICFRCQASIADLKQFFTHLRAVHSINSASTHFECNQNGCQRTFYYMRSYRRHLVQHNNDHNTSSSARSDSDQAPSLTFEALDAQEHTCVEVSDISGVCDLDDLEEEDMTDRVALFLAKLKSKSSQTFTAVNFTVQETSSLLSDIVSKLQERTMSLLKDLGQDKSGEAQELNRQFEAASEPFKGLETEYRQMKYFMQSGNFIQPVEEAFPGISYVQHTDSNSGTVKQISVCDTFQRIPLRPLLKKILELPGIMSKVIAWQKQDSGALQDFCDGELCKFHALFSREVSIPLLLYIDDVETVNPLGSKTSVHKLGFMYFAIKCLPKELLSSLSSLFLLAVYKTDDAKTYGIDAVLKPIVEDIKSLEKEGVDIKTSSFEGTVKVSICQVVGDNLGLNAVLGFTESFARNYACRWCRVPKEVLRVQVKEDRGILRTAESNERDIGLDSVSDTGLKRASALNDLHFFDVSKNMAPDIMQDILEGVGSYEMKMIINSLIEEGHFTLDTLNYRITSFDYGFSDVHNKPTLITKHYLRNKDGVMKQTAAQMWCLLRLFPLMVGDLVPESNRFWELLLLLLSCMELIFSPSLTVESTIYLKWLIEEHHTLFIELYPHQHLKPKHHFMLHYPRAIRQLGPLVQFWTMRFEAKHGFFKRISHITCNFRNICKTMAIRHQVMLCYNFFSGGVFDHNVEVGQGHSTILADLERCDEIQGGLENIPSYTEVYVPAWVKLKGTTYRPGMTVFVSYCSSGDPQFGCIRHFLAFNSKFKLVIEKLVTVGFERHLFAFAVQHTRAITCIDVTDLTDHHPVHTVQSFRKNDDCFYVSLRYRVL